MNEILGPLPSTVSTGHDGKVYSNCTVEYGGGSRRVENSQSSLDTSKFKASIPYMRSYLKENFQIH